MDKIAQSFARQFAHWKLTIPEDHLLARKAGHIKKRKWLIQYCFGLDKQGEYMDFYGCHPDFSDEHARIHANGMRAKLDALWNDYDPGEPEDAEYMQLQRDFFEHNMRVASTIREKGFHLIEVDSLLNFNVPAPKNRRRTYMYWEYMTGPDPFFDDEGNLHMPKDLGEAANIHWAMRKSVH